MFTNKFLYLAFWDKIRYTATGLQWKTGGWIWFSDSSCLARFLQFIAVSTTPYHPTLGLLHSVVAYLALMGILSF